MQYFFTYLHFSHFPSLSEAKPECLLINWPCALGFLSFSWAGQEKSPDSLRYAKQCTLTNLQYHVLYSDSYQLWLSEYLNTACIWLDAVIVWPRICLALSTNVNRITTYVKSYGDNMATHRMKYSQWRREMYSHLNSVFFSGYRKWMYRV